MKRAKFSEEEIATVNLLMAMAFSAVLGVDIGNRRLALTLREVDSINLQDASPENREIFKKSLDALRRSIEGNNEPLNPRHYALKSTKGAYVKALAGEEVKELKNCFREEHLFALHRILLMGLVKPKKTGSYRSGSVHVGNPDIIFPPESIVPSLMNEFLRELSFCLFDNFVEPKSSIMDAARLSHKFVAIHPFADGNGRLSRVIMNLVLSCEHPDIYIKADKKGRHRYIQALRRADRGKLEPLCALIAMSLIEVYEKLLRALGVDPASVLPD